MKLADLLVEAPRDTVINNVRKGDPLYDKLAALAKDEIAAVRGKSQTMAVKKRLNGASFIVVGFKDADRDPYFRIDKADIKA